jgi:hypothetical protein
MPHSMLRNTWLIKKVPAKFTHALSAVPAGRVSRGWISVGTSQPRGPLGGGGGEQKIEYDRKSMKGGMGGVGVEGVGRGPTAVAMTTML